MSRTFEDGQPRCHFEDILDRLPLMGQHWIKAATPRKNDSKEERLHAFAEISKWVMRSRAMLFSAEATSYCCIHDRPGEGLGGFEPDG